MGMEKITLKKVIEDIKSGKSKAIYLCPKSLWWTHLESDLTDSFLQALRNYPKFYPDGQYSPIGQQCIINNNPFKFIKQTQSKPQHFGKHGLKAFMKAHHQNNSKFFYNKWKKYNELIDKNL